MTSPLLRGFLQRAGLPADARLEDVVRAVQRIRYGRPRDRSPEGVLSEWTGTCSTKHALLATLVRERWPEHDPRLVHRVYRVDRELARRRYGSVPAAAVPEEGLTDVHRYLLLRRDGRDVVIDVTFPGDAPWDGRTDMPMACGPGQDHPAGPDPDAEKAVLEAAHCDPAVREPFIAALSRMP
ncbi:arylamine N-acetyltransferase [Actinomadura sp. K4S16]|uniref:arylamine N-acetyltransferase n=1 Tax=Actinomadura sp. K4S16 TaxID=1316147 RepID=UPI0011EDC26F|nr:arylamine N-acetyltransferase [Actinomadura sp. K4S16]